MPQIIAGAKESIDFIYVFDDSMFTLVFEAEFALSEGWSTVHQGADLSREDDQRVIVQYCIQAFCVLFHNFEISQSNICVDSGGGCARLRT